MSLKSNTSKTDIIKIFLAISVTVIALLVRMPSAFMIAVSEEEENAFTDDSGLPYFTDTDSYYHVRLVNTMLKTGRMSDTTSTEGEPWDLHSYYPDGRSAVYQPGIVYLTVALWKIFNLSVPMDISRVEYYLPGFMAMITALVAFITGCHIQGKVTGFVAGILTACAPEFVSRTSFGRFDTDIFVVLMNVLLILFFTEMLRTEKLINQLVYATAFVLTAVLYANCWAPQFSTLFAGLTVISGLIYSLIYNWRKNAYLDMKKRVVTTLISHEVIISVGAGLMILLIICVSMGISVVIDIFKSLSFKTTQNVSEGVLPNIFDSISELQRPDFFPDRLLDWFRGYILGSPQTVITGIGGAFTAMAALSGLVILWLRMLGTLKVKGDELPKRHVCGMYFVVLGLWAAAGLYLSQLGIRFIEILTVPTGLLAGILAGWLAGRTKYLTTKKRILGSIVALVVVGVIIVPNIEGIFLSIRRPTVTDASADAMKWVRENASDPDALIESWWDMGYFYESESDHPCLWDGGTQDPVRTILYSRAMTEDDMETSRRILNMLACSGNKAVDCLMEYTDTKNAFDVLWEVLPLDTKSACNVISDKCGVNMEEAQRVENLIHPRITKEAYLVLTYTMMVQTEWYEYYSDWDFTGTQPLPNEYNDSEDNALSKAEEEKLERIRGTYTMWRLFFDKEINPYFTQECEFYDGIEGIRIFKVSQL
ncbi:MAG: dolichyl-diphosphooligosaccharide--protein glycosyltransferase subunit STT3 [Lachnospiraceae bacterium]|nr:dolichyl-diphosphooligosaccharide--protein glycosyltransferase subunit STT3 [Lachnospiraceae bacterium]